MAQSMRTVLSIFVSTIALSYSLFAGQKHPHKVSTGFELEDVDDEETEGFSEKTDNDDESSINIDEIEEEREEEKILVKTKKRLLVDSDEEREKGNIFEKTKKTLLVDSDEETILVKTKKRLLVDSDEESEEEIIYFAKPQSLRIALTNNGKYLIVCAGKESRLFNTKIENFDCSIFNYETNGKDICEIITGENYIIFRTDDNSVTICSIDSYTGKSSYLYQYQSEYDISLNCHYYNEIFCGRTKSDIPENLTITLSSEDKYTLDIYDSHKNMHLRINSGQASHETYNPFFEMIQNNTYAIPRIECTENRYRWVNSRPAYKEFLKKFITYDEFKFLACIRLTNDHKHVVIVLLRDNNNQNYSTIKIFNITSQKCITTIHTKHCDGIAISENDEYLVSYSGEGDIKIWEIDSGECIKTITCEGSINALAVSKNKLAAIVNINGCVINVYDVPFDKLMLPKQLRANLLNFTQDYDLNVNFENLSL